MKKIKNLLPIFAFILILTSCIDNDAEFELKHYKDYDLMKNVLNIPQAGPMDYTLNFPSYYGRAATFDKNLVTLGRVIFYDEKLSADGTISCASCHKQELAFSDDKKLSDGILNNVTERNSLALGAVFNFQEYYGPNRVPFFWDNSVQTVEEQIVKTFGSKKEMDMTIPQVVEVINDNDYYKPLIFAVSGRKSISDELAVAALASFVNSLGSYDSRFDQALSAETNGGSIGFGQNLINRVSSDFVGFTQVENKGKTIYLNNCASCHGEIMGAPNELAANNGLVITDNDFGVKSSQGEFKVPSLRNLTLTYPYMHDGRFATIADVVDHYSTGISMTPSLHPNLKEGNEAKKFNFTDDEKTELISFLKTFDDESFLVDPKYSDPFIR